MKATPVGCVAKTHRRPWWCVVGSSTHHYSSSVVIGRLAERDDLSGIGGLLRLEGDFGDAAGFRECERRWGFTAEGTDELGEQVGHGVQRERARRLVGSGERHLPVDERGL